MKAQRPWTAASATAGRNVSTAARYRAAALGLLAAGVALGLAAWSGMWAQSVHAALGPTGSLWSDLGRRASVEDVLLLVVASAATVACGWLALLLLSGAADLLRPQSQRHASRSPLVTRVSAVLLAVALGQPVAMAATDSLASPPSRSATLPAPMSLPDGSRHDGPGTAPDPGWTLPEPGSTLPEPGSTLPEPGWTPQAASPHPSADGSLVSRGRESSGTVVVQRGDTLWDIAARHLGAGASPASIAEHWPRWWAANAEVIGADPDLILPGQVLRPPALPAQAVTAGGVDR